MQRSADTFISRNEREFILKALQDECRLDGRRPFDLRKPKFQFSLDDTSATVTMGQTRVVSVVAATLEAPYPDRPTEGALRFNVEFSPMASPAFEPGRPGEDSIEVARLLDRGLRQSRAVDQEALCVVAGRKVWSVRVDTHVLDHGGNLIDACFLSALAALMAFRKPEVELGGEGANTLIVHPPDVREPLPLTIHHLPVAVTFALFEGGDLLVADPSYKEEAAAVGSVTLMVNPSKEVCCVHKADGVGLSVEQLLRCIRLAGTKADEVVGALKAALQQHEVARVQARVRRHKPAAGLPADGTVPGGAEAMHVDGGDAHQEKQEEEEGSSSSLEDEDEDEDASSSSSGGAEDGQDAEMQEASSRAGHSGRGQAATEQQQAAGPRVRLGGPLAGAGRGRRPHKQGQGQEEQLAGAGAGQSNKRGNDRVRLDELEVIAAVIAGADPRGGQRGAEEPDLAMAIKPPGKRRTGAAKPGGGTG